VTPANLSRSSRTRCSLAAPCACSSSPLHDASDSAGALASGVCSPCLGIYRGLVRYIERFSWCCGGLLFRTQQRLAQGLSWYAWWNILCDVLWFVRCL
jgi:hypothetical protein